MDLRSLSNAATLTASDLGQARDLHSRVGVELTTPEGHTYTVGRLSIEDRRQKILRYASDWAPLHARCTGGESGADYPCACVFMSRCKSW